MPEILDFNFSVIINFNTIKDTLITKLQQQYYNI